MTADDITQLLISARQDDGALHRLLPAVYEQLRTIAHHRMASQASGATLSTTALVHEAYLKLFDAARLEFQDRRHFYSVAAMAMRQIVVDRARRRRAGKRGSGVPALSLEDVVVISDDRLEDLLSLDEALSRLKEVDERLARVVELRFFGGLSIEETADVLGVDPRTVKRDWRKARALLHQSLTSGAGPGESPPPDARGSS